MALSYTKQHSTELPVYSILLKEEKKELEVNIILKPRDEGHKHFNFVGCYFLKLIFLKLLLVLKEFRDFKRHYINFISLCGFSARIET